MTPTAFAFLIPVFVVVVTNRFHSLCVFCIRRRQRPIPPLRRPQKKPALRRKEARQRLGLVTDVVSASDEPKAQQEGAVEEREHVAESSSVSERECAICLSTLHAPSPPEPALITSQATVDDAAVPVPSTSTPDANTSILKLQVCSHEFHSECLVSWFVLRKTSCPICRAAYISKEEMKAYEDEEAALTAEPAVVEQMSVVEPPIIVGRHIIRTGDTGGDRQTSNWGYFWRGEGSVRPVAAADAGANANVAGIVENGGVQAERPNRWRRMLGRT
ncbi:hypothetical protein EK21DRAFT_66735 [Setomelanomma holmii]|uniref:RING-type domain-containing protein n=1 Tax=Setomelanomma holmii TaxID=210430 RepID=A0A9P4H7X9_9PLEO|nr:hypothetical protein EK21DRAFT_66735 [Setomelanomma holmii]